MHAQYELGFDGQRLITVTFVRQTPDANAPTIDVVYEVKYPEGNCLASDTAVLKFLSATRTDSREPIPLTKEEIAACDQEATEKAAEMASR